MFLMASVIPESAAATAAAAACSLIQRGRFAEGWAALREIRGPFYDAYSEYEGIVTAAARMPTVSAAAAVMM